MTLLYRDAIVRWGQDDEGYVTLNLTAIRIADGLEFTERTRLSRKHDTEQARAVTLENALEALAIDCKLIPLESK